MKVIFALGNPGAEYAGTRHNIGFIAVDLLAKSHGATFSEKTKFHAYTTDIEIAGEKALLVKPTTFYNNVGQSARALIDFYKLSPVSDLLVVHDDLSLPLGTIRVRKKGSDAGNNGIKSLNSHVGADYTRVRVGIGTAEQRSDDSSFVLSRFNSSEATVLKEFVLPKVHELLNNFLSSGLGETSYQLQQD